MPIGTPHASVKMGAHAWPISHAVGIGLSSLAAFVVTLIALQTSSLSLHFSYYEVQALDVIVECAMTLSAGCIATMAIRRRSLPGFWSSIQWHAPYIEIASFGMLGLCLSVVMRYVMTQHFLFRIETGGDKLFALIILGTVVLQPFMEEIYFRGILFTSLAERLGPVPGIIVVTIIFVLFHSQHHWIVLPMSIVVGIVRICTRSTANCFVLHAGYNLGVILWGIR
jgi:membrane protease YdiL (CAAX protease family)